MIDCPVMMGIHFSREVRKIFLLNENYSHLELIWMKDHTPPMENIGSISGARANKNDMIGSPDFYTVRFPGGETAQ